MANISTLLEKIRTAIYGKEMREAIHDSIEMVNNDIEDVKENIESRGFVVDANYVHTDNNYTTAEKDKLAGIDLSGKLDYIEGSEAFINTYKTIYDNQIYQIVDADIPYYLICSHGNENGITYDYQTKILPNGIYSRKKTYYGETWSSWAVAESLEDTKNKTQTLSASSTHDQYPTAKAVWDLVGNVEAALEELRGGNV